VYNKKPPARLPQPSVPIPPMTRVTRSRCSFSPPAFFWRELSLQGLCFATLLGVSLAHGDWVRSEDAEALKKWGQRFETEVLPIIQSKCLSCHTGETPDGEFDLSKFPDGGTAAAAGDAWERVAKRVRLNEMPPQGSPGLSDPEKSAFHRWVDSRPDQDLCHQLASDETQSWYRGHVMSRRLSRYEYANAIRDLVGYSVPEELLPPSDGAGGLGFDTVGDALFTSPIHIESYLRVATASLQDALQGIDPERELTASLTHVNQRLEALRAALRLALPDSFDGETAESRLRLAAEATVGAFARRAWRRPIEDRELKRLMHLMDAALDRENGKGNKGPGNYVKALSYPLQAILISPHFLFLVEPEPDTAGVQRLTPHQFATRMALLLWSSVPDAMLLDLADANQSFEPETIRTQLHRMLADDRSRALGENFGLQWLGLKDMQGSQPDRDVFPDFDAQIATDAIEETVRTVRAVFVEARPLTDLIDSDSVIVNARLAAHYEIAAEGVDDWARVPAGSSQRGGILTMASVLIRASYPRRTSPVLRGRWILEDVLGAKVPPPPPNVPALDESTGAASAATLRERLELHRTHPECASCHQRMDPLGFALENFDAIGRWRTEDAGMPVDARGTLPSGESFAGPAELKRVLMNRQEDFEKHFVRKLLGYALGRDLNKFDQCVIDSALKRLKEESRADVLLEEILLAYPFQHRYYNPARSSQ